MATAPHAPVNYLAVRPDWLARRSEPALEPELPIVDAHHHLWDRPGWRYLLDELLADIRESGHNIAATVFMQCLAMHRAGGPEALRPVGETEFVNGVAAMAASGIYGSARICAGIVGRADLRLGRGGRRGAGGAYPRRRRPLPRYSLHHHLGRRPDACSTRSTRCRPDCWRTRPSAPASRGSRRST